MPQRLAGSLAILAFAVCLLIGGLQAGNTFTTTIVRALVAMAGTFVVGLVVGAMGQRMLDENVKQAAAAAKDAAAVAAAGKIGEAENASTGR
ncbi:MAG TPA: hypothetical protein VK324_17060 [Tepidisphaeraceae bacterium]|nr:hypothetical protein [Tepidisphaeraceae bacterium]